MRLPIRFAACSAALLSAAFVRPAALRAQSDDDRYTAPRNATVDARGASAVRIHAEAGILRVEGKRGLGEVRVRGTARASRERDLEDIQLIAERHGNVVEVRAEIPEHRVGFVLHDNYRGLDLVLEVPDDIALDVEDGSGDLEIRGVGDIELRDGSGDIELTDVGSVRVEDGSGELKIRNVRGDVTISDGSGRIDVRTVSGTVTVRTDGSGSIDVSDVGGDFVVGRDGSGGIAHTQVRGDVRIPRRKRG